MIAAGEGARRLEGQPPEPVLVPLVRGGAEERNGVPWLYLNDLDDSVHARSVRDALVCLSGRTPNRRRTPVEDATAVKALTVALAEADVRIAEWEAWSVRVIRACPNASSILPARPK